MDVRSPLFQNIALIVAGVLFLNPIVATAAQLAVDQAAGGNTAVTQAQNGVPMVNIATPNGSGLSHNKFTDYNVGQQGLILNNSAQNVVQTQLGGYVVGNPNLKNGAAGLILNEVTGGNASQLKGYTEVAGRSAAVIVANPHGITCDGCGFINTPRVTLSTGTPVIENGRLQRFDVNGGQISIEGQGLNAGNVDQFDLITRSAQINAELHAKKLNIITGRNEVDATRQVGTEQGVGVKLADRCQWQAEPEPCGPSTSTLTLTQAVRESLAASQRLTVRGPSTARHWAACTPAPFAWSAPSRAWA
nr:filamentous hemagglutinin N-terminal domain-containing protein [Pseudomonas sp. P818]